MTPRLRESRPVKIVGTVLVGLAVVAVYVFLYAPMIITALFSVNDAKIQTLPYTGFTTKWYTALFEDEKMVNAILYSLRVAIVAVLISACAAILLALIVHKMRVRGGAVIQALLASPLVAPGMVLGISLPGHLPLGEGRTRLLDDHRRPHHLHHAADHVHPPPAAENL